MIKTLLHMNWLNLKRDRVALILTFLLPIIFFTIFAFIFGGMSGGGSGKLRVIVVDEDQSETSARFIEAVGELDALRVIRQPSATEENPDPQPFDRDAARRNVQAGNVPAAIIIPQGFGESFGSFTGEGEPIDLIYDAANPFAQHSIAGLMQAAAMQAAPDMLMDHGLEQLSIFGGGLTPQQQQAVDTIRPYLSGERSWDELDDESDSAPADDETTDDDAGFQGLVQVRSIAAREDEEPDMVSYYAAGISVMFLLFSMAGAGGAILEEEETGTLERLLSTNVGMGTLLMSKWAFFWVMGMAQIAVMFLWGAFIFGLDLWTPNHLFGCIVMMVSTGAAAASFGIVLATLCRSHAQLSSLSTIIILIMSALGGSMVPRFIMPAFMDTVALFTFNGWALDGFLKVFWYENPDHTLAQSLLALWPQVAVLVGMTLVFLIIARNVARRWEVV